LACSRFKLVIAWNNVWLNANGGASPDSPSGMSPDQARVRDLRAADSADGVVVFSATGEPEFGEFEPPAVPARCGGVPPERLWRSPIVLMSWFGARKAYAPRRATLGQPVVARLTLCRRTTVDPTGYPGKHSSSRSVGLAVSPVSISVPAGGNSV
jgi:hypothetical protein